MEILYAWHVQSANLSGPGGLMEPDVRPFNKSLERAGWKQLLNNWIGMLDAFDRKVSGAERDVAYWYGERALTGLLAAAAWKSKGWGLEEWTTRRGRIRTKGAARGDLWLETEKGKFTIEAKVSWPSTTWKTALKAAKNRLADAEEQLRMLDRKYRYGKPLAVCYIVPEIERRGKYDRDGKITEFFENIASSSDDFDITATHRPGKSPEWGGRKYPGVILVGWLLNSELKWK